MMHEVVIAIAPEREQDFILSCLRFREDMPQTQRKYLLGPIVATGGDRCFVFLPCSCPKVDSSRIKFLDHAKGNSMVKFCHIKFGEGFSFASSDQSQGTDKDFFTNKIKKLEADHADSLACLKEEIKDLIDSRAEVQATLQATKIERDEAVRFLSRDTVLSEAVSDLKVLRGRKKFLEAAAVVAVQFKDSTEAPACIKALVQAMLDHDEIIDQKIAVIKGETS